MGEHIDANGQTFINFDQEPDQEKNKAQTAYETYIADNIGQISNIQKSGIDKKYKDKSLEDIALDMAKEGDSISTVAILEQSDLPISKKTMILANALRKDVQDTQDYIDNAQEHGLDRTGELNVDKARIQRLTTIISSLEGR